LGGQILTLKSGFLKFVTQQPPRVIEAVSLKQLLLFTMNVAHLDQISPDALFNKPST
jgi:hypothetical protein